MGSYSAGSKRTPNRRVKISAKAGRVESVLQSAHRVRCAALAAWLPALKRSVRQTFVTHAITFIQHRLKKSVLLDKVAHQAIQQIESRGLEAGFVPPLTVMVDESAV
jgi:hypothetical protein